MKQFNDDNFVLETKTAQDLYHNHAAKMPIIDYHCHLIPEMVANDHRFKSITELWLGGDHYKWRAMRTNGVDERYCTGKDTSDWEKFEKWAETVPYTFRNPLYHWTHLELKTAFGITNDIFDAGLTSIGAIKLNVMLSDAFGVPVTIKDLREHNTIQSLETFFAESKTAESFVPPMPVRAS